MRPMNPLALVAGAAVAAAVIVLASCSSSSSSSSSSPAGGGAGGSSAAAPNTAAGTSGSTAAATAHGIVISNFAYSGELTVHAGATVTVTNMDSMAHTLTDKATHKFDTGNIAPGGGTGTFTAPSKAGKYPFGCTYHPNMAGTLTVVG